MEIVLIIPEGFGKHVEEMNRRLASREFDEVKKLAEDQRPIIVRNSADEKSQVAYNYVNEAITSWEANILKIRLHEARLPETLAEPVRAEKVDLAEEGQLSAVVWSKLFSAMLVIMAMTGAFYPAVDLAAGEKERGTMETLLICPATRTELVLGKFFTVMLFSLATAILNLISLGITSKYVPATGNLSKIGSMAPPTLGTILWVIAFMLPLTALFQRVVPGARHLCPQHEGRPILSHAAAVGDVGPDHVLPHAGHGNDALLQHHARRGAGSCY